MVGINPVRFQVGAAPQTEGGFNPYAAGAKHYGSGRPMPNIGKVDNAGAAAGYHQRDVRAEARRDALIRRAAGGN